MIEGVRFGHVNVIAQDWRRLVDFYMTLFGCEPVPPERDLRGPVVEAGTGVPGATLNGMHLRLPGHGPDGPTLEIYGFGTTAPSRRRPSTAPASATSLSRSRTSPRPGATSLPPVGARSGRSSARRSRRIAR